MISLNQKTTLIEQLKRDEALVKHFDLSDYNTVSNILEKISEKQYSFILALLFNKKRTKLNEVLTQIGFKQNI